LPYNCTFRELIIHSSIVAVHGLKANNPVRGRFSFILDSQCLGCVCQTQGKDTSLERIPS
jgi:hypothetical protein